MTTFVAGCLADRFGRFVGKDAVIVQFKVEGKSNGLFYVQSWADNQREFGKGFANIPKNPETKKSVSELEYHPASGQKVELKRGIAVVLFDCDSYYMRKRYRLYQDVSETISCQ